MAVYEVFKSFYEEEDAIAMLKLFSEQGINGRIEKARHILDKVTIGDDMEPPIHLKISPDDFTRAHQVIDEQVRKNISALEPDYYLYSFSDEELFEILKKPDEWSDQDFVIAQKILADRGRSLSDREINKIKSERINELGVPEKEQSSWIVLGYVFTLLMPIVGLFFGLFHLTSKKLLPDGRKVALYDEKSRKHGAIILALSTIMIVLALLGKFGFMWESVFFSLQYFSWYRITNIELCSITHG